MRAEDQQKIERLARAVDKIYGELDKKIVGMRVEIEQLLISILSGGHCLLVGVPGLAKTLLIRSLAELIGLDFARIQFTPDLMPSDITGTELIALDPETGERSFKFVSGPIFHNVVLADEINRTPPKTQAALMEAMEEHQVTCGGTRHSLPRPFFVLATQNPIEQEGTYPLPVAQLDRFMFNIKVGYPSYEDEKKIMIYTTSSYEAEITPQLDRDEVIGLMDIVRTVEVPAPVLKYATRLVRATRAKGAYSEFATSHVREYLQWGCGPRAAQGLLLGGKARAMIHGRSKVSVADIQSILHPTLRHRLIMNYHAESEGVDPDAICDHLLEAIEAPDGGLSRDERESRSRRMARV